MKARFFNMVKNSEVRQVMGITAASAAVAYFASKTGHTPFAMQTPEQQRRTIDRMGGANKVTISRTASGTPVPVYTGASPKPPQPGRS